MFWDPSSLPYVIDWQAWATFAVGLPAVIGATIVGLRQATIASRQSAILERQVNLDELNLRADLYDRRLEVFLAVRTFIDQASIAAGSVGADNDAAFATALGRSRFLFGDAMQAYLDQVRPAQMRLKMATDRIDHAVDVTDELLHEVERGHDELNAIREELNNRFRPYLGLVQ